MSKYLFLISIFSLLSGCAGHSTAPIAAQGYLVEGKLAILQDGRNQSANFRWRQSVEEYEVEVWGPLGQGRTHFRGNTEVVSVSRGNEVLAQGSPTVVMQTHLGYSLPVAVMSGWLQGRTGTDSIAIAVDELDRLTEFEERNWRVKFSKYREIEADSGRFQPSRIVATQGTQRVTVAIRNFVQ